MTEAPTECNNKIVPVSKKRKAETVGDAATDPIPRLIDNKRKHMERQLSAAQRDQLLLKESKEDSQFKKDMADAIIQSDQTFANAMQQMSQSISQVAQGMTQSMQAMSQAFLQQNNSTTYHQSYPGHNPRQDIYNNFGTHQFSFEMSNLQPGGGSNENHTESYTYHTL